VSFIYLWPTWLIIIFEIVVFVVPAVAGHLVVRRFVPNSLLAKHNDVTGFVLAIVGVIYAVLLAFVVIIAWEAFDQASSGARTEVAAASDLYRFSGTFRDPQRSALRAEILQYSRLMEDDEWPAMQSGEQSAAAQASADRISDLTVAMIDADPHQRVAVDNVVTGSLREFLDARRTRLDENSEGIPDSLWVGLVLGATITIAFTYLFGAEEFRLQLVVTALLATIVALMFSMIVALDYPYRGSTAISPEMWSHVRQGLL
jgi:hypothetical protein